MPHEHERPETVTRAFQMQRQLTVKWLVVVHFVPMGKFIHALVYVESRDGHVADAWVDRYTDLQDIWRDAFDRVVFDLEEDE